MCIWEALLVFHSSPKSWLLQLLCRKGLTPRNQRTLSAIKRNRAGQSWGPSVILFYFLLIIMINIMATPCIEGIKTQSFPKSMTQPLHSQLSVRFLGKNFRSFFCTAPYLPKKLSALSVPRVGGRGSTQSHTCRWVS